MYKYMKMFLLLVAVIVLTGGCGQKAANTQDGNITGTDTDITQSGDNVGDGADQSGDTKDNDNNSEISDFQAEVIEAKDTLFIAPDPDSAEFKSSDKISVNISKSTITDSSGNEIAGNSLKPGDIVLITYNGVILESYPAQITADAVQLIDHNILIDGYLAIIDDIWQLDTGLNSDIDTIGIDTSNWIELTDIEKEIIFAEMKNKYSIEIVEGTSEDLAEQGLIDKDKLFFPKGVLITIDNMNYDEDNQQFTYSISKWRSGDGAIGSENSTANFTGAKWEIKNDGSWIS